jgi:hypothetical protein
MMVLMRFAASVGGPNHDGLLHLPSNNQLRNDISRSPINIQTYLDKHIFINQHKITRTEGHCNNMDLKHILNPIPEPDDPPRINNNPHTSLSGETVLPPIVSPAYLQSRFYLSPRRFDPETSSVSTNSSTKRRRTNRASVNAAETRPVVVDAPEKMGRSFSELQVPSDSSTDEDGNAVKRGVAQLSLTGIYPGVSDIDEYSSLRPGTRVEALMSGTRGTWYVARIVEFASFPPYYIDGERAEEPAHWLPMVCVHYEGTLPV